MLTALDLIDKVTLSFTMIIIITTRYYITYIVDTYMLKKKPRSFGGRSVYRISIFRKETKREAKPTYLGIDDGSFYIIALF